MRTLRCLLISALPPGDSDNGDAQYTRDLLADPPEGIVYVPYQDALASGELVETASWRRDGHHPGTPGQAVSATSRLALNLMRRTGVLLPDPVRWWRTEGHFDLVHMHCMPTHFSGPAPPIVLTDSAGTFWYWTRAKGFDEERTWRLLRRERRLATRLHYTHPSARPDGAARALYFVQAGIDLARQVGADSDNFGVCPVGVPAAIRPRPAQRSGSTGVPTDAPTLAFVAGDFELKGGPATLEIFRRVQAVFPGARLLVAGSRDRDPGISGVEWLGRRTRAELYYDLYPQTDVFVYPTRFDGAPLVVVEALAHGIPVVAPSILALPELVRDGETGLLFSEGDIDQATGMTLRLLGDEALWNRMSAAAVEDFSVRLSAGTRNRLLGAAYRSAAGP